MDYQMDTSDDKDLKNKTVCKTGYNINNLINIELVANNFIKTYFTNLSGKNIQSLIEAKILRDYTTIKFNNDKLKGVYLIEFLNNLSCYNININTYNYIDSGSRRIDISVIGFMTKEMENINFNQTFIICYQDDSWYIKNSIFLTF